MLQTKMKLLEKEVKETMTEITLFHLTLYIFLGEFLALSSPFLHPSIAVNSRLKAIMGASTAYESVLG